MNILCVQSYVKPSLSLCVFFMSIFFVCSFVFSLFLLNLCFLCMSHVVDLATKDLQRPKMMMMMLQRNDIIVLLYFLVLLLLSRCIMSSSEELIELVKKLKRERSFISAEQKHIQEQYTQVTNVRRTSSISTSLSAAIKTSRTSSTSPMDHISSAFDSFDIDLSESIRSERSSKIRAAVYSNSRQNHFYRFTQIF